MSTAAQRINKVIERLPKIVSTMFQRAGNHLQRIYGGTDGFPVEASANDRLILQHVTPYTMTSPARVWAVINSVKYITASAIEGDIVECGVWRGGSAMAAAYKLKELGEEDRHIWLYDTFSGMTEPSSRDVEESSGKSAEALLHETRRSDGNNVWCIASINAVRENPIATGYPVSNLRFIAGDVLNTLDREVPERISLLRLDTDWYESTRKELQVLFPRLARGGVCIIDDYGHWRGSRMAVDEYLVENCINVLLSPIDQTGRIFLKP
jgi:O-methyltransferase